MAVHRGTNLKSLEHAEDESSEVRIQGVLRSWCWAVPGSMMALLRGQQGWRVPRGCYELAQEWLANAENGGPTVNSANRGIRILMRFFNQVHNTL